MVQKCRRTMCYNTSLTHDNSRTKKCRDVTWEFDDGQFLLFISNRTLGKLKSRRRLSGETDLLCVSADGCIPVNGWVLLSKPDNVVDFVGMILYAKNNGQLWFVSLPACIVLCRASQFLQSWKKANGRGTHHVKRKKCNIHPPVFLYPSGNSWRVVSFHFCEHPGHVWQKMGIVFKSSKRKRNLY